MGVTEQDESGNSSFIIRKMKKAVQAMNHRKLANRTGQTLRRNVTTPD